MKLIELSQGKQAIVDDEDYEWLSQWKWCFDNKGYARRSQYLGYVNGKQKTATTLMHRQITGNVHGMQVDHINGNKLDNRRSNLRLCTHTENMRNSRSSVGSYSKYKGVWLDRRVNKWAARICCGNRKRVGLGYFSVESEAAEAYNAAAKKYHGKFARLNVIDTNMECAA